METQTMKGFRPQITTIKGLSDRRRMPLIGRIRLGLKKKSVKTGNEYPTETDFFVVPDEVKKEFGNEPKELDVMIPVNDLESVFPCSYVFYGSSKGVKCRGDGELAYRVNDETKEMDQITCPCQLLEDKKCKQVGRLLFMIPKVSVGGVFQITTSSFNSIVDLQSGLDYVSALVGRFAMIPLKLRRVKTETHHDGKKQNHYTLQIILDANIDMINSMRLDTSRILEHPRFALPAPVDENPEFEPVDVFEEEEENGKSELSKEETNSKPAQPEKFESHKSIYPATEKQIKMIFARLKGVGVSTKEDMQNFALEKCGKTHSIDWTNEDIQLLVDAIERQSPERIAGEGDN